MSFSSFSSDNIISNEFYEISKKENVPVKVLYAIALQESKTLTNKGRVIPWKYTLNYSGKGYFYHSKDKFKSDIDYLISSGNENFDFGIAQINYRWHKSEMGSIDKMINPYENLTYAAKYLRQHFKKYNDWWLAVGAYHSPSNKMNAKKYRNGVYKLWLKL